MHVLYAACRGIKDRFLESGTRTRFTSLDLLAARCSIRCCLVECYCSRVRCLAAVAHYLVRVGIGLAADSLVVEDQEAVVVVARNRIVVDFEGIADFED